MEGRQPAPERRGNGAPGAGGGVVAVAVAVVVRAGRDGRNWLLIDRRLADPRLPDLWEFPGGKIHAGETGAEAARRETREETGVAVSPRRLILERPYAYPGRDVWIEFHLCDYLGGVPEPLGCQAVRWVRPENLGCYRFPDANEPILRELARGETATAE